MPGLDELTESHEKVADSIRQHLQRLRVWQEEAADERAKLVASFEALDPQIQSVAVEFKRAEKALASLTQGGDPDEEVKRAENELNRIVSGGVTR